MCFAIEKSIVLKFFAILLVSYPHICVSITHPYFALTENFPFFMKHMPPLAL